MMPDREKVIKGVHDARRYLEDREWVDKSVGVHIDALNDALALLKELNEAKPIEDEVGIIHCGNCNAMLEYHPFYCWHCGQKVKWE